MSAPEPETWVRLRPRRLDTSGPDRPGRRPTPADGLAHLPEPLARVIVTPLAAEATALRLGGLRSPTVVAGVGARRLRPVEAGRAPLPRSTRVDPAAAVLVAGVGGALREGLPPGTLVVAEEVVGPAGRWRLAGAECLARALRRDGLGAVTGRIVEADRLVVGADRLAFAGRGDVVDMESARLLGGLGATDDEAAACGPRFVVRAISDGPGDGRLALARGGVAALNALRRAAPTLERWLAACEARDVLLAAPRSFCAGVERAIDVVERALERFGAPVYVRRQIVHNSYVVGQLEAKGAVFVEELDEVPPGSTVVLSAHGVAPSVRAEGARRGLAVIDATCPLVTKVHVEARRFHEAGRHLVLIGHAGHDEVEGTLGEVPGMRLVETAEDVARLDLPTDAPVAFLTQTTLAADATAGVVSALRARYPDLAGASGDDICFASHNRQEALRALAAEVDAVLVVSSPNSSNGARLVELARRQGCRSYMVDDPADTRPEWLEATRRVGITAAASAPESLVRELVATLGALGPVTLEERVTKLERVHFPLPPEVR